LVAIEDASNIFKIDNDGDIYEDIGKYGILITDYSGIYFDYMITGRPIIMAPFDLDKYIKNDRDLYYDYEDICPDTPCYNWNAVMEKLKQYTSSDRRQAQAYMDLKSRFHEYLDDRSSMRAYYAIKKIVFDTSSCEERGIGL
jgi:CDP-glycerol glycerophosphotransferase